MEVRYNTLYFVMELDTGLIDGWYSSRESALEAWKTWIERKAPSVVFVAETSIPNFVDTHIPDNRLLNRAGDFKANILKLVKNDD